MEFISSNWEDISRYFKSTYVKFPEYGDKLFYIREVYAKEIRGSTEDDQEFRLYLNDGVPYTVEYVLPKKSFFQNDKHAYLLARIPARQYKRGVSNDNTGLIVLDSNGKAVGQKITMELLRSYVNKPKFPSFEEAVSNKQKHVSTALSPRIAMVHKTKTLFVDTTPVASLVLSDGVKGIKMIQPIFTEEVKEIVRGSVFEKVLA